MPRGGSRVGAGRKSNESKLLVQASRVGAACDRASSEEQSPLDFLLEIMRDEQVPLTNRMQAASICAPYLHARVAPAGKKESKQAAAKEIVRHGTYAPMAPPRLVAAGGKIV